MSTRTAALTRRLIVNADDFGQSPGINRGIQLAHERGILTSASLMVRWPHAAEAAAYARIHTALGVGLHLDFGEWTLRDGEWVPVYSVVDESDAKAVEKEVGLQLAMFRELMHANPTHIDSHQHRHRRPPASSIVAAFAREIGVPVRDADPRVRYCGRFYGQLEDGYTDARAIGAAALSEIICDLQPGYTEVSCHPADTVDVDTLYRTERLQELATLCDPSVRAAVVSENIELCSFRALE